MAAADPVGVAAGIPEAVDRQLRLLANLWVRNRFLDDVLQRLVRATQTPTNSPAGGTLRRCQAQDHPS